MHKLGVFQAAGGCSLPFVGVPEGLLVPSPDRSARRGQETALY